MPTSNVNGFIAKLTKGGGPPPEFEFLRILEEANAAGNSATTVADTGACRTASSRFCFVAASSAEDNGSIGPVALSTLW